jgi:beta-galactosidase/beta-glucuronidase
MSVHNHEPEALRSLTGAYEEESNPLPRSVVRPNTFVLLDGSWDFALDPNNKGIEEQWHLGHEYHQKAHWPGSIESFMGKDVRTPRIWNNEIVVWYERTFTLPEQGTPAAPGPGRLLQLTFGACGYETRVWLNGMPLKTIEGADIHIGEYTSFSFELPEELLKPENRLTVRIADTMDADTTRGKQESHVYKRGGIWYQTSSGATRSVWLEPVERNRLRSRVGVVSVVEDNLVRVNLTTRIHDPGDYTIHLKVYERKQTSPEPIATDSFLLRLDAGQKQQRLVIEIPDAQLWSLENPHLYRLVAQLEDSNGHIAQIETQIGLRKIEARGRFIYLNNKPVYLDGILYQPGDASYEEIKRHMYAMKELGCNLVRIHIAGVDPRIYHLADKLGLLLWVEVPSPHASTLRSRANHRAELLRMLALIESHPSVIIWSLYNEDWGAQDIATNPATRQYITDMYHYMQINHPQFLIVDNDGWQHVSLEGRLKSDLLTAHLYTPDVSRWHELLDAMVSGQLTGVAVLPLTVGDPFFYRKQLPLIVSEWGGFGFSDYGGPAANADRASLIRSFKDELRKRPIAGDVYTQATDIEDERNGIIDAQSGTLKVPAGLLRSRNAMNTEPDKSA